ENCLRPCSNKTDISSRRRPADLKIDQALLQVHNELLGENVTVYWLSDHCYQCLYQRLLSVPISRVPGKASIEAVAVDSEHPVTLQVNGTLEDGELCRVHYHFGEFGNYSLKIQTLYSTAQEVTCNVVVNEAPVNSYLPI
uniref:Uncharacterized protein n=1 Tax=Sphenodon punctatus TaxID=8508 RepID=A0A8D0GYR7_SPHPU